VSNTYFSAIKFHSFCAATADWHAVSFGTQ
jgi:hypothetical protein